MFKLILSADVTLPRNSILKNSERKCVLRNINRSSSKIVSVVCAVLVNFVCSKLNMSRYSNVDHVIFDLDGILLGTEEIYVEIFSIILSKYDKSYTSEVRQKVLGTMEKDSCAIIVKELDLPIRPEELLAQQCQLQREMLPKTKLMPGAERLIQHLHKHGIPIAVATSSSEESVTLKLTNYKELFSLFHHVVMGSSDPEVKRGKPNPDIFLTCASRFQDKPTPEKCLVFEDAPNGVKAAHAAGMQVVMVPDEYISEENKQLATLVLHSLEEFKPELFGLPQY